MLIDVLAAPIRDTSPTTGYLIMAVVAGVWAVSYVAACLIWPLSNCRKCKGAGKHQSQWGGNAWRPCRRCTGTGARIRTGRRVFNFFHAKKRGTR